MKVIELLNKIANDGKKPKIKFNNSIYEYHDKEHGYCRYYHDNIYICLNTEYYWFDILNEEVEIIEESQEHKIPEKLDQTLNRLDMNEDYYRYIMENRFKINEIIDYLEVNNDRER